MSKTKKNGLVLIVLLFVLMLLGCTSTGINTGTDTVEADGKQLYDHITAENNYKNWTLWPGEGELEPAREPHGAFVTTYVSEAALSSINAYQGNMSEGSIIVKENFNTEKELTKITVMYKVSGYDAEHGDWFWVQYAPDGTVESEGMLEECSECHGFRKKNDYIYTGALSAAAATPTPTPTPTPEPTPEPTPRREPIMFYLQIKQHKFSPPGNKEILVGDTVQWRNTEEFKNPRDLISDDGLWEEPVHLTFNRFYNYTFNETGTYTFRLRYNEMGSMMNITVI